MSKFSPLSSSRWKWNEIFFSSAQDFCVWHHIDSAQPSRYTSTSLPPTLESCCCLMADVRTRAKITPLSGSCFSCDIVPDHFINAHLKMWPPPGTLTDVQFPDTGLTTNLLAGDGLKKTWPQPHSLPVSLFPFQATLEKRSLITEYQGDFATIPACRSPSHPENRIPTVICFSAYVFLFPQSLL